MRDIRNQIRKLERIERELREVLEYCDKHRTGFDDVRWSCVYIAEAINQLKKKIVR